MTSIPIPAQNTLNGDGYIPSPTKRLVSSLAFSHWKKRLHLLQSLSVLDYRKKQDDPESFHEISTFYPTRRKTSSFR
jgi:hypothetical protein